MNETPNSPAPLPAGGVEAELRGLRQLLQVALAGALALAVGINLFLFRQVSMVTKDLAASRRLVEDYEKKKGPLLENLVTALQEFSKSHPDFEPILEKYGLKPAARGTPPPSGAVGAGTTGR